MGGCASVWLFFAFCLALVFVNLSLGVVPPRVWQVVWCVGLSVGRGMSVEFCFAFCLALCFVNLSLGVVPLRVWQVVCCLGLSVGRGTSVEFCFAFCLVLCFVNLSLGVVPCASLAGGLVCGAVVWEGGVGLVLLPLLGDFRFCLSSVGGCPLREFGRWSAVWGCRLVWRHQFG